MAEFQMHVTEEENAKNKPQPWVAATAGDTPWWSCFLVGVEPSSHHHTNISPKSVRTEVERVGGAAGLLAGQEPRSGGLPWAHLSLVSLQVIPFAADCDQDECTCRDPAAEENQ